MMSISWDKVAELIETFYSFTRHLNNLLNIGNIYFDRMANQLYPLGAPFTKLFMTERIHKTRLSTHFYSKLCYNFIF